MSEKYIQDLKTANRRLAEENKKLSRYLDDTFLYTYEELQDKIIYYQHQLQQKENIIKEVRKYIEENKEEVVFRIIDDVSYNAQLLDLLDILDKGK